MRLYSLKRCGDMEMKDFKDVVELKMIPTTFVFHCTLCGFIMTDYDRHMGLVKMNEHIVSEHSHEVNALGKEDLYSRHAELVLGKF
jgi:hypothetical protein